MALGIIERFAYYAGGEGDQRSGEKHPKIDPDRSVINFIDIGEHRMMVQPENGYGGKADRIS